MHATREPLQIGAEIYGHAGLEADAEIQELALSTLALAGFTQVRLDLTHVGVLRAIIEEDAAAAKDEAVLYLALRAKDVSDLKALTANYAPQTRDALLALTQLYGDIDVLKKAREVLPDLPGIARALAELAALAASAIGRAEVAIDLADLRELARLLPTAERKHSIRAPWGNAPELKEKIAELRKSGEVVIQSMPGHSNELDEFECDRALVLDDNSSQWILKNLG